VAKREPIDVAVVDYQLAGRNGLWLSRKLKRLPLPPAVLIYSAYTDGVLAAAAVVAEADALARDLINTPAADLGPAELAAAIERDLGPESGEASAILKDEDRCIRCALCVMRCPTDAIAMDRVTFSTAWRTA